METVSTQVIDQAYLEQGHADMAAFLEVEALNAAYAEPALEPVAPVVEAAPAEQLDPRLVAIQQAWMNAFRLTMKWQDRDAAREVMSGATNAFVISAAGHFAMLEQQRIAADDEEDEE